MNKLIYKDLIDNCDSMLETINKLKKKINKDFEKYLVLKGNIKPSKIKKIKEKKDVIVNLIRNEKQKEWYNWRKRAKRVGVSILSSRRPTEKERSNWKLKIIAIEKENGIYVKENKDKKEYIENRLYRNYNKKKSEKNGSFVYLIQDTINLHIKIGYSTDVNKRLSSLQTSNPNKLRVICYYSGTLKDECKIHKEYESKNVNREWYSLGDSDLKNIDNYFNNRKHFVRIKKKPEKIKVAKKKDKDLEKLIKAKKRWDYYMNNSND